MQSQSQLSLFGHYGIFDLLKNLHLNKKIPNKIILSGEKGIGKCTLAYHLINYILSSNEDCSYDTKDYKINIENKSFKLIQNKSSPNFNLIDVEEGKKNIDINQIRNLISNLNKSSFNSKPRIVLIDNVELLNTNSVNALLKILEEPTDNTNFILINNNKNLLPTLRSRCLNFKITFTNNQSINVVNKILKEDINDIMNNEIISYYSTPGYLLKIIDFSNKFKIDLKNTSLKDFLFFVIKNSLFKDEPSYKELIYSLIESYFRNNISLQNTKLIDKRNSFLQKIDNTKKFNLDEDTIFMEFEDKILND